MASPAPGEYLRWRPPRRAPGEYLHWRLLAARWQRNAPPGGGTRGELPLALPGDDGSGAVEPVAVAAAALPMRAALPVLSRARAAAQATTARWGAAALPALQLVARRLLLPGLSAYDHEGWRAGPLCRLARPLDRLRRGAPLRPGRDGRWWPYRKEKRGR